MLCPRCWPVGGKLASFQHILVKMIFVLDFGPMTGRVPFDASKARQAGPLLKSFCAMSKPPFCNWAFSRAMRRRASAVRSVKIRTGDLRVQQDQ
jgi:hypothetical protein